MDKVAVQEVKNIEMVGHLPCNLKELQRNRICWWKFLRFWGLIFGRAFLGEGGRENFVVTDASTQHCAQQDTILTNHEQVISSLIEREKNVAKGLPYLDQSEVCLQLH